MEAEKALSGADTYTETNQRALCSLDLIDKNCVVVPICATVCDDKINIVHRFQVECGEVVLVSIIFPAIFERGHIYFG